MSLVSLVTPLYNKGAYIAATIASVQAQTHPTWELIVVENGSTDAGPELAREAAVRDQRVRLVESPRRGPGAARNFGLSLAAGEWVLFLDADDLLEPPALAARLAAAAEAGEADLVVGGWEEFPDGSPERRQFRQPAGFGLPAAAVAERAIAAAPWSLHAAMVRRSWLAAGERRWQEDLDNLPSEDTAFWFRVVSGARIAWLERSGAVYRLATPGSRNESRDVERWVPAVRQIIARNVAYLRSQGGEPNAAQCARIMRGFEANYRRACALKSAPAARLALTGAQEWLSRCPVWDPAILPRKVLGLKLFNRLRYGTA